MLSIWTRPKFCPLVKLISFQNNKFQTLPNLKSLQMTILKVDENGRKFSRRFENTVGKGEIARYEQFFLFSHCFNTT